MIIVSVLLTLIIYTVLYLFPIFLNHFEFMITDLKFNIRSKMNLDPNMNSDIVLVAIDDESKVKSGYENIWPYSYYSQSIKKITDGNPSTIGLDIIFTNTNDTIGWSDLIYELEASYKAINPYVAIIGGKEFLIDTKMHIHNINEIIFDKLPVVGLQDYNHFVDLLYLPDIDVLDVSSGLGFVNIKNDSDGKLRRLPIVGELDGKLVPHFCLKLISEHLKYDLNNVELVNRYKLLMHNFPILNETKTVEVPLDGKGNILINYLGFEKIEKQIESQNFFYQSAWPLINSQKSHNYQDKIVIFGDHSLSARDYSSTPIDGKIHNPLIFSMIISNILNNDFIKPVSGFIHFFQVAFILAILIFCSIRFKVLEFILTFIIIILLYIALNFTLFINSSIQINVLLALIPSLISGIYLIIYNVYDSQLTMGVLEGSLQSYLSPNLMEKIKDDPDILKLGGERKRITVLFSDISAFTSFTDNADPAEVQLVLEEYFSVMSSIVFQNNGIVDKYLGDGILAFYENPKDGIVSAQLAIKSAIEMKKKAKELDAKYRKENRFPFSIYIGIATGYAKVGNIGPPDKIDYTIIGSVVNKASRLDGIGTPNQILLDEDTYFFVKDDYMIEDYGKHILKGFDKPVQIYELK